MQANLDNRTPVAVAPEYLSTSLVRAREFVAAHPEFPELTSITFEAAEKLQRYYEAILAGCDGDPVGLELKSDSRAAWATIFAEMSDTATGEYRIQFFDELGFSGHSVHRDVLSTLEEVIRQGYHIPDPGRLDQLSLTPKWQSGMARAELLRQLNSGLITNDQFYEQAKAIAAAA